ncbi:hypothetical protein [Planococcus sp. CAU13]|uniref:hypothetical protein n=1 Tax=Planococcus sp. CAU13 TaxID=1541197 RepID=UPI0005300A8F|nr:hypothetical protein [Planococcus sp. CAU13]
MGTTALIIFIFLVPYFWFFWTFLDAISGKAGKPRWKIALAAFLALVLGSFIVNYYLSDKYGLSFFQNGFESIVALIIAGAILLVVVIVNIVVSIMFKNAPKSVHNPKAVWVVAAGLCTTILFFTMWVYPFAEKTSYINKIETALDEAEERQDDEDITVVFLSSERKCLRTTSSNCHSTPYSNTFFVKNNMDATKEVQLQIRALDRKENELKTLESDVMTLEAGELRLVETAETSDMSSIWHRSSFVTDVRTYSSEWQYHYRDVK